MKHKQKPNNHQGDGRNQQTKSGPEQDGNKESHEGAKNSNEESNKDMQIPKGHYRMSRIWSNFRHKIARNCFQVLTIVIGLLGIIVGSIVAAIYYRQLIDMDGQDMLKGSRYVIIYARATYRDSFGIDHWTQYCADEAEVAMTTHSENCVNYNDTDNNQKPN